MCTIFGFACIWPALIAAQDSSLMGQAEGLEQLDIGVNSCNAMLFTCVRDLACSPLLSELPQEATNVTDSEHVAMAQCAKNNLCAAVLQCVSGDTYTTVQTRRQMQVNTGSCTIGTPIAIFGP